MKQALWIDIDNSPHVPLFAPIIRHYRRHGVEVTVTAREHSQTIELLKLQGLDGTYEVVGRHYGGRKLSKIAGTLERARELVNHLKQSPRDTKIAVAVSHGSRSLVLAARWLRIPVMTMYDYEYTETRIFNRFSDKVLVPDRVPDDVLDEIGLPLTKRIKYPGIKEELYTKYFAPESDFRQAFFRSLGLSCSADKIVAVLRPPATTANYHADRSEVLLDDLLDFLRNAPGVFTVVLPRTAEQASELKHRIGSLPDGPGNSMILEHAVDGLQLAFAADLLISGGGTMNREAALLGVPVYSIFAGRQGALDRQMEAEGRITFIRDARDLSKIRLEHRKERSVNPLTDRVESFVIKEIDSFLYSTSEK